MKLEDVVKSLESQRDFYYKKQFDKGLTKEEIESFRSKKNELNDVINSLGRKWLIDYTNWILSLDSNELYLGYELLDIYLEKK